MRSFRALALILAVSFTVGLFACTDRVSPQPTRTLTPTVEAATGVPPAIEQILQDVAKIRELSPPPALKANLIARSDLPALLDRLLTDEDRKDFRDRTTLYQLVGHLRKDQDMKSVFDSFGSGSVLGLYSPLDGELWVVHDDGQAIDFDHLPAQEKSTLAHELVHAIQDYHFHLADVYRRVVSDIDLSLTWTCVVEGDAVTHENLYSSQHVMAIGSGRLYLLGVDAAQTDVPASIAREFLFPYLTGADWIKGVRRTDGTAAINELITNPPKGSAYVLHPELQASGWVPAIVALPDLSPALGPGWQKESGGTFGEFQLRNYLQLRLRATDAAAAAAGWNGDHYDVYTSGADSVAAFRVRFQDATQAAEFADAQQRFLQAAGAKVTVDGDTQLAATPDGNVTATVAASGDQVVFVIGSNGAVASKALAALLHA
jgi:hypothetical protein